MTLTPEETRQYVDSLVAGGSLAKIPAEYHPQLLMPLSAAKNEAIVAGNSAQVKRIQVLMKSLKLGTDKTQSARRQKPMVRSTSRSTTVDEPVMPLVDELMDGRPSETVDDSQLAEVIQGLRRKVDELKQVADYHGLQIAENLIQELNARKYEATYASEKITKMAQLQDQLNATHMKLSTMQEVWKEKLDAFNQKYLEQKEALIQDQQKEMDEFNNSFPMTLPANFRKLSPQVLQLREQEKHLFYSKRYEDAIFFRDRADKLELQEMEVQRVKFNRAFEAKRKLLIETQKSQFECFEKHWERMKFALQKDANDEIRPLQVAESKLIDRINTVDSEIESSSHAASTTGRITSRAGMTTTPLKRSALRSTPASVNPRIRNYAASRMTPKTSARLSSQQRY